MIELLLVLAVLPVILPAFSLIVLTAAAVGARWSRNDAAAGGAVAGGERPRAAVLVPAHDESAHLLPTLACVQAQLDPGDRLVVIADNCSDDTAAQARAAGAEVIERHDPDRRGKGYALAFGVDHLRRDPPEVVLIVDADCLLSAGAVPISARECRLTGRPVQMLYLLTSGAGAGLKGRMLEFAMVMKNLVRPLGGFRLGGACHLTGSGMAFPWPLIAGAELATGHITEDMKLGVELARAGHAPRLLVDVQASSAFVRDDEASRVQKTRWEHGHLAILIEELPGLLGTALYRRDPALLVLAMDLMIPPVAFYVLLLGGLLIIATLLAWSWPVFGLAAALTALGAISFALAIILAWFCFGRRLLSWRELLSAPLYALWKLPVYVAFFLKKRSGWVRTKRDAR